MNRADDGGTAQGAEGTAAGAGHDEPAGAGASTAGDEPRSGEEQSDEERARAIVDELRRLKVEDLALDMTVSLVTVGYQKLGLTAQTRELRDLGGAHLAIELLRALLDVLQREVAQAPLGDLRSTLATMQLEYARAVAAGASPAQSGAAAGGAAPAETAADEASGDDTPGEGQATGDAQAAGDAQA